MALQSESLKLSRYVVDILLSAEQIEQFYAGAVTSVWVRDVQGLSLQFPLRSLRPFIGHHGVSGRFVLCVNQDNRLVSILRR